MSASKCRLIVHADDFGISEHVNQGIIQAHDNGILTSTSIMATGAAFEHAVAIAKSSSSLDTGIHLTLAEEAPLLETSMIPSLVDDNGNFHNHATTFIRKYANGAIKLPEVYKELNAQIGKVMDYGLSISHLDSHQHLHALPGIRKVIIDLANKFEIPAIRLPRERIRSYMLYGRRALSRTVPLFVINRLCGIGQRDGFVHTDSFTGFFFGGTLDIDNMKILLRHLPRKGTCELMCHPGLPGNTDHYDNWKYNWSDEYQALISPEIKSIIDQRGIELISYRDIIK